jgi:hypothetical protein
MFAIEMLPAEHGDCLWIEYGPARDPLRVLIDGGIGGTWDTLRARIAALPSARRRFELVVVSHIDADHIGGAIELLRDESLGVSIGDVWFNGYRHLPREEGTRGAAQGERLTEVLKSRRLPWNNAFRGDAVVIPEEGPLPCVTLAGGLTLTLLSPYRAGLERLRDAWDKECEEAGLVPGRARARDVTSRSPGKKPPRVRKPDVSALLDVPFTQDTAEANGSSIAFLAEFDGRRALFAADAYPSVLIDSFERWMSASGLSAPVHLDAFKVSHHGSRANTTWQLLYRVECDRYLFSTDGSVFDHPDDECVARVIAHGGPSPELIFNYRSPRTERWGEPELTRAHGHRAVYPEREGDSVRVELAP